MTKSRSISSASFRPAVSAIAKPMVDLVRDIVLHERLDLCGHSNAAPTVGCWKEDAIVCAVHITARSRSCVPAFASTKHKLVQIERRIELVGTRREDLTTRHESQGDACERQMQLQSEDGLLAALDNEHFTLADGQRSISLGCEGSCFVGDTGPSRAIASSLLWSTDRLDPASTHAQAQLSAVHQESSAANEPAPRLCLLVRSPSEVALERKQKIVIQICS